MSRQLLYQQLQAGAVTRRLVVIVPDQDIDQIRLSRAIRAIPCPNYVDVLLVTVVNDADQQLAVRRRLATIASIVRDYQYSVDYKVCPGRSWARALAGLLQPGDLLVYPPELSAPAGLARRQPLAQALQGLGAPLYPLKGFFHEPERTWLRRLPVSLGYWAVVLLILILFFNLESTASLSMPGGVGNLVTILLVLVEFGAVYLWTTFAG